MLTFAYRWLLALIVLPPILRRLLPAYRQTQTSVVVPFLGRLAGLTGQQPASGAVVLRPPLIQRVSLWLVWLCLVLALARPQWLEKPIIKTLPTPQVSVSIGSPPSRRCSMRRR
jgi:Ca-activated chloride channel family protein